MLPLSFVIISQRLPPPKRRLWKAEQKMQCGFRRKHFSWAHEYSTLGYDPVKIIRKSYAPQTKILEGGTKDEMRISKEALFRGVSTQFGQRSIEKCFLRNPDFVFCSTFQNLRLGGVNLHFHLLFILPNPSLGDHKIGLIVEYSRMRVHSVSRGCETCNFCSLHGSARFVAYNTVLTNLEKCLPVKRTRKPCSEQKKNCAISHPRPDPEIPDYKMLIRAGNVV